MKIVRTEEGGRNLVRAIVDRWVSRARSTQPTRTFAPPLVPTCKRGEPLYSCRFGCVSGEMKITTSPNPSLVRRGMKIVNSAIVLLIQSLDLFGRVIVGYRRRLVKSLENYRSRCSLL